ncbi:uncharacterized protein DSM5745_09208 [Aspergillus mulundensis]|uniref:Nucleotidyl transferase AbiEii/AbiGii toxin family protein n=1 Tax=Aspergillus mulundensis TaxID=1810919 RepID=A0A3D8QZV8_9EURO|nr:hypothetical protein DSM5745_09208 [Aspergillus mulundensis]RDW67342.1 hypothetical protein DSM5745_09208 [Aspergillus mulundensis]
MNPHGVSQSMARLLGAAADFMALLKSSAAVAQIPGYAEMEIMLVGGAAVIKHTSHRVTKDIDFAVSPDEFVEPLKRVLLKHHSVSWKRPADAYYFIDEGGNDFQVDIMPIKNLPYKPSGLQRIVDVDTQNLPIANPLDLICFKSFVCGFRESKKKNIKDAEDVKALMKLFPAAAHLAQLSRDQVGVLKLAREALLDYGGKDRWWEENLPPV